MEHARKRNRTLFTIAGILLLVTLVTASVISGTLAKYVTTATASSKARVAEFNVSMGDGSTTLGLFDTILDSDGSAENDVAKGTAAEAIIAPGTTGELDLLVTNDSEVTVSYTLSLSDVQSGDIPIEFSVNNGAYGDLSSLTDHTGTLSMQDDDTINIKWRWVYYVDDTQDIADTDLGTATVLDDITVTASVLFEQVD